MDPQQHYDARATSSSKKERLRGPAGPLKQFHNTVKRALLTAFTKPGETLLDIACGRGGDVRKWTDLRLSKVVGLDIAAEAIQEARRRAHGLNNIEFMHVTTLAQHPWQSATTFDAVSCMFALHYFWASEASAHTLFQTIAANVKEGGYVMCVLPSGVHINRWLLRKQQDTMCTVTALWTGPPQPFGSPYLCAIEDTVTTATQAPEYLVYENVLTTVAFTYNLHPITTFPPALAQLLEIDTPTAFKPFRPMFPASTLFVACVFEKRQTL